MPHTEEPGIVYIAPGRYTRTALVRRIVRVEPQQICTYCGKAPVRANIGFRFYQYGTRRAEGPLTWDDHCFCNIKCYHAYYKA